MWEIKGIHVHITQSPRQSFLYNLASTLNMLCRTLQAGSCSEATFLLDPFYKQWAYVSLFLFHHYNSGSFNQICNKPCKLVLERVRACTIYFSIQICQRSMSKYGIKHLAINELELHKMQS